MTRLVLVLALWLSTLSSMWLAACVVRAQPRAVQVRSTECAASWFDRDAFLRVLRVELVADGMSVDETGELVLVLDVPCDDDAPPRVTLGIGDERRSVPLVDVEPSVRMRALALASRDFVGEVTAVVAVAQPTPPEEADETSEVIEPPSEPRHDAEQLALPEAPLPIEPAPAPPVAHGPRAFGLVVSARASWLGLRVVAPSLSIEGEARIPVTPLVLWLAIDGLYAVGSDGLGEVRAFDVGGRIGVRAVLDLDPVTLAASVGVLVAYGRAEGAPTTGTRGSTTDGVIVGIDAGVLATLAVSSDVRLILGVGVLGYLVGFDARAESRPVVSFRDAAPWVSFGVGIDLPM